MFRRKLGLAALRIYTGVAMVLAGVRKICPAFDFSASESGWLGEHGPSTLERILRIKHAGLAKIDAMKWFADIIDSTFIPHAATMTWVVVVGEILIGLGFIVGFLTRTAALFAIVMGASFYLLGMTDGSPLEYVRISNGAGTLIILSLAILLLDAGRSWGIDGRMHGPVE